MGSEEMIDLSEMVIRESLASSYHVPKMSIESTSKVVDAPSKVSGHVAMDRLIHDLCRYLHDSKRRRKVNELLNDEYDNIHHLVTMNRKNALIGTASLGLGEIDNGVGDIDSVDNDCGNGGNDDDKLVVPME